MCMLYHPDKHQDPAKKKVSLKAQALFAASKILFVLQNNPSTRSHFQSERFFSPTKIFSTVTKVQRCRREDLEAYNFLSDDKLLCSLTAILHHVIQQDSLTQTLKTHCRFLKTLLILTSHPWNFVEKGVLELLQSSHLLGIQQVSFLGKAFRIFGLDERKGRQLLEHDFHGNFWVNVT